MKLKQLIFRYWKEYKHINNWCKLNIDKNYMPKINKQYVEEKSSIIYLLTDICSILNLQMEKLNINILLKERRNIRHNINWIIKKLFQKEVEKLLGNNIQLHDFFEDYYKYNNEIEFSQLMSHPDIIGQLNFSYYIMEELRQYYKIILVDNLFETNNKKIK